MTLIIVDGSIFNSFKEWLNVPSWFSLGTWFKSKLLALMSCYQCSGFWSGGFIGFLMWAIGHDSLKATQVSHALATFFIYGCIGSYVGMKAAILSIWIQSHSQQGGE